MASTRDVVIVTGVGSFIGRAAAQRLSESFDVVGLDLRPLDDPALAGSFAIDLGSDGSAAEALEQVRERFGSRIASVIHLAAYFDLTGEPNAKYQEITVNGTGRLLSALQGFEVEQFIFASTMLVHAAVRPGETIDETSPLDTRYPYRASKVATEQLIHERPGSTPVVYLRAAGVYDDLCRNAFLANQIARIYERSPKSYVYPGDPATGQSYVHIDDLVDAFMRLIERRTELPGELPVLVGEPDVMGYGELQDEIGRQLHGTSWSTWEIPKPIAKAGSYVEADVLDEEPFIRPWMVDVADDHYALDIGRARELLGWTPRHSLRQTLPKMLRALNEDPVGWYRANKLNVAMAAGDQAVREQRRTPHPSRPEVREHMAEKAEMHRSLLWAHLLVVALGAWLLTSPLQFALLDPEIATLTARDVTAERDLWDPALRNALTGWSNIASGLLLMLFGSLSLNQRFAWAQWGTTIVGLWLLFAPLLFWTPSAAAYMNDTIVGALAIALSVLIPMMPGMSHEAMMDEDAIPPGWTYSPSSWLQRLPIILLGLFGFFIARYLAAYQLGHINGAWEPFFHGALGRNGTEHIITSDVSKAWPIADAGLGATAYMLEALMGAMGAATRWRTMPWMVTFFFILVVPLGGVSIFFILIQPVMIGTYCTLCLIAAFAMLIMIPLAVDEVVAMGQYMVRSVRAGQPFVRTFLIGGPDPAARPDHRPGFEAPFKDQVAAATWGVPVPWTLVVTAVLGAWLMFTPLVFGTMAGLANSDHVFGGLVITVSIIAMAEIARPLRFLNVAFGLWLVAAPWLLIGATSPMAFVNGLFAGVAIIALSLPCATAAGTASWCEAHCLARRLGAIKERRREFEPPTAMNDRIVTVFGGTGFLGRRVAGHLATRGFSVRVASRHPDRAPGLFGADDPQLQVVAADIHDERSVADALAGAFGVVNAVSLYVEHDEETFHSVHVEAAKRVAAQALRCGVERLAHVSGIGSDAASPSLYIRKRGEGELAVRAVFVDATLIRPAVMFGPDDAFLTPILKLLAKLPAYPMFGRGLTKLQPAYVEDVAEAIARALQDTQTQAITYECAGPRVYTYEELLRAVAHEAGLRPRLIPLPFAAWHALAWFAEMLPSPPITRNQVELMQIDNLPSPEMPGLGDLGISPHSIEEILHEIISVSSGNATSRG